ncbi:hypothetical protein DFH28DRAFT_1134331 [Melampsora americana]|nr:hypothetical protein DFH28DRAFT_1134331 [Melampsora americana]
MVNNTRNTRRSGRTTRSSKAIAGGGLPVRKSKKTVGRRKAREDVHDVDEEESDFGDDQDRHSSDEDRSNSEQDQEATVTSNVSKKKSASKKGGHKTANKKSTNNNQLTEESENQNTNHPQESDVNKNKSTSIFRSRFPGFEMDNFEDFLDDWTLVDLRQTIAKQASTANRAHPDIDALVKTIRLQYEKRMLMAALMGGVPEAVIWNIVGEGGRKGNVNSWIRFLGFCKLALDEKLPARASREEWATRNKKLAQIWKALTDDERTIFKDPYFFALANLPDLSYFEREDAEDEDGEDLSMDHIEASASPPKVHQLSDTDRSKYMPIFRKLVDVDKLHACHGRPEPTASVETLQKKSLSELRKAHHDFSVVCQRYQVTYYLTAVSCGSYEGWSQTFSNNLPFARWAETTAKVPSKFSTYIHGKTVGKEIEASKVQQPSDERKTRLTRQLNSLVDAVFEGNIFPKVEDPKAEMAARGWPIRIVQKTGSLLSPDLLDRGHRRAKDSTVQLWLKDIESGHFVIELIPESERQPKQKKSRKKKKQEQHISSQRPASADPLSSSDERDNPTQSQAPQAQRSRQSSEDSENEDGSPRLPNHKVISESQSSEEDNQQPRVHKKRVRDDYSEINNSGIQPPNQKHKDSQSQRPHARTNGRPGDVHDESRLNGLDGSPIRDGQYFA